MVKILSMNQTTIRRLTLRLNQYHFKTINTCIGKKIYETLPGMSRGFSFISHKDYGDLSFYDKHGWIIPVDTSLRRKPELNSLCCTVSKKTIKRRTNERSVSQHHTLVPAVQWETTTTSTKNERDQTASLAAQPKFHV